MLKHIIKQDWRTLAAERTVFVVTLLLALGFGYALYNGVAFARARREAVTAKLSENAKRHDSHRADALRYERELNQPVKDPAKPPRMLFGSMPWLFAGSLGLDAVQPAAPLAALSVGQADLYLPYTKISIFRGRHELFNEAENENPLSLLDGRFDLAFVIVYLLPLVIIALSYSLLSAEREQGTLALVLSQPLTLSRFALGKLLLRGSLVIVPLLVFNVIGAQWSAGGFGGGVWWRLLLWCAVVTGYGLFWLLAALAVNALGRGSATNALWLAAIWLAVVLVIPSLVNLAAVSLYPMPARIEQVQAVREAVNEIEQTEEATRLVNFYRARPAFLPAGRTPETALDGATPQFVKTAAPSTLTAEEVARRVAPMLARFDEQSRRQQRFADAARFLSPAMLTQFALNDLAGSGAARHESFRAQVEQYAAAHRIFFAPKVLRQERMMAADYDLYPRYQWREEPASTVARRVLIGVTGLLIPALLLGWLGLYALRRFSLAG